MSKNIKTQEAKLDLITKFLDYANNDEKGFLKG